LYNLGRWKTLSGKPEEKSREIIDQLLAAAGWIIQDLSRANVTAGRGVAIREFPLKAGHGFADYLLYVDGAAAGVVEAKKEGATLTGVEIQTARYSEGLPENLKAYRRPLPFCYQTTGIETRFTNLLEPDARSRPVFAFHKPETLADWLMDESRSPGSTLRARLKHMPPLISEGLWPAQIQAIGGLERSLAEGRPRALIQMASGGGKTFTACNFSYRLIQHAKAQRILFLVDRNNLGKQAYKEFQAFATPDDGRKFTELYNVQRMQSNNLDTLNKVVITTIQRLYSMLKGEEEFDPENEEGSMFASGPLIREPPPVAYNPALPIETFDFIVTDECHRSIYNLWRQVLEYFDAFIIGLTATPSKQTLGFFDRNLVMEYNHEQAVADGVNVDFDVYRIRTVISEHGSTVNAGFYVDKRDRQTRKVRWEQLDEDLAYRPQDLDRDVVAKDQLRTIIRTFKEKLFTEIFPGRKDVPKTLIFAKDDSHADDVVQIVREEFGKGNEFCQKITYRTAVARVVTKKKLADGTEVEEVTWKSSGLEPEDLLSSFRNSYYPRIVVTVDMIATGTDVRPLEIVFFMREVRSRTFFEQMKGRGVRVVTDTEFQSVTPDARSKTHFVIVDAVGLCEEEMVDAHPLERKPSASFEKLLQAVSFGNREPEVLSSLASRLARLDRQLTKEDRKIIEELNGGKPLTVVTNGLVNALDPDAQIEAARKATGIEEPPAEEIGKAASALLEEAAKPIAANPSLRNKLIEIKKSYEQTIDTVSKDEVLEAGFSTEAREKARSIIESFENFIQDNKDEIAALQVLYSRPYKQRLTFKQIRELADAIQRPPRVWTPELLWRAYETLDKSKVRGSGGKLLTDIVSLVRVALHQEDELRPYRDVVNERFEKWLSEQNRLGRGFTGEQQQWLELIRDHIAASLAIEPDDFDLPPLVQRGGLGRAYQLFGEELEPLLNELNEVLAA
jgi:type I restriction enzyme R subunit